jgi:acetoacetyl-CoA synthetase
MRARKIEACLRSPSTHTRQWLKTCARPIHAPSAIFALLRYSAMTSKILSDALWRHPFPKTTRLDAFRRRINQKYKLNLESYEELHKWSVEELEAFNAEIWNFCRITYSVPPSRIADGLETMWPPPNWFPGAMLNYSENLLAVGLASHPDAIAVSGCREGGVEWRHLSWRELQHQVRLYACAIRQAGVQKGDRIAAVVTNSIEAVLLLLAAGWVGAIFSSTAPDMGVNGVVERFVQIQPKILFIESAVQYASKKHDFRSKFEQVMEVLDQRVPGLNMFVDLSNQTWNNIKV